MEPRDALVGTYVQKTPPSGARRALLGKVASHDPGGGLFRVVYEDGECEDLEHGQVSEMTVRDDGGSGMKLSVRKRKLDQLALTAASMVPTVVAPAPKASEISEDADSSCEVRDGLPGEEAEGVVEMPELPESSGDIDVPEESVSYLFSVYNFLRSFSVQLFLSPFGINDFVGALNCNVQNTLLDAVHICLMRTLRRHLETLSEDANNPASKCLKHYNWALLDMITWPVFLVEYLYLMGYMKMIDKKDVSKIVSTSGYYALPVATKLKILQILCDDIIDSDELRTELERRESAEEECDVSERDPPESTPLRVHPRNSKTSAWKESEAMTNSDESNKPSTYSKVKKPNESAVDADPDENIDECVLCGMDGTLLCCDGCPSAYHSRCIGLNKMLLPNGLWFCPECSVNKLGQTASRIGRGARGAEVFGIDSYGRMFLGTCNYLLVIGTLPNIEFVSRYYNQNDITTVLSVIFPEGEKLSAYVDISRGISKYWEIPLINTQIGKTESITNLQSDEHPGLNGVPFLTTSVKSSPDNFNDAKGENHMNNITESSADNREILSQNSDQIDLRVDGSVLDPVDQGGILYSKKHDMTSHVTFTKKTSEAADSISCPRKDEQVVTGDATRAVQKTFPYMQNKTYDGNGSVVTNVSDLSQPVSAERSSAVGIATSASGNEIGSCREDAGSSVFSKKNIPVSISDGSWQGRHIYSDKCKTISEKRPNTSSSFRPQAYINQYLFGDVAASAAANLAVLASEETRVPEAQVISNPRKAASATIALQTKAFSGAAMHFLWPSYEKKLMDVPRERCGWCYTCKSASTYKRACLLNVAAANAVKGSARNINGIRPIKYNETHLCVIGAHIANMEETLHNLVSGPFLDVGYTQQWRKRAREASSFRILKSLLFELEKNIRGVAFSVDWNKMVDDWSVEISSALTGLSRSGPNQKRGAGRRSKRQSLASELVQVSPNNSENDVRWWRGGKLSKIVFQKGTLPNSLAKKAARQGGRKRVPGSTYSEVYEFPRRSRQVAWRASVEMSKNASQLALQVRYLDAHLRWRDLSRPDQSPIEGKGSDVDASVFRNAAICDKRVTENKIIYALTFDNQKHLPLRVTKNILESETIQDGKDKLWFSENHIPLYLINEFEEKDARKPMSISSHGLLRSWGKLKSRRRDVFSYLLNKWSQCLCASCQVELFLRDAVRCNTCQGYCHKDCTTSSTLNKEDDLEFLFTCKICYRVKSAALIKSRNGALNVQMPSQLQNEQKTSTKCILKIGVSQTAKAIENGLHFKPSAVNKLRETSVQLSSQGQSQQQATKKPMFHLEQHQTTQVHKMNVAPEMAPSVSGSNLKRKIKREGTKKKPKRDQSYGLIWKRKDKMDVNDSGNNFRLENIILKSNENTESSKRPMCCLCCKPYNSELMYIRCEKCPRWFHADALNLEEEQIFDLIGYKCTRCRKIHSATCPYSDKKPTEKPLEQRTSRTMKNAISKLPNALNSSTLVSQLEVDVDEVDNEYVHSSRKRKPIEIMEMEAQTNGLGSVPQGQRKLPKLAGSSAPVSYSESEDIIIVDDDPLLPLGRVMPIEPVLGYWQPNGPGAVSQGQQKLSVKRPQVKQETSEDVLYAPEDAYSRCATFSDNLQNLSVNENDAEIGTEHFAIKNTNFMGAPENVQLVWDSLDTCGNADGDVGDNGFEDQLYNSGDVGDIGFKDEQYNSGDVNLTDVEYQPQPYQPHGPNDVNFEDTEYEPQTWFSFSELLACEDTELDNRYDMPKDILGNDCPPTSYNGLGIIYQDPLSYSSGAYVTGSKLGMADHVAEAIDTAFDAVACEKCKTNQPSPDLTCSICGLHMHSHCSPWVESAGSSKGSEWRCGSCRDWR